MPATATTIEPSSVPRGLKGVQVADTTIGDVRGLEGFYHYRQYNAVEIAERLTFEDAWHLLIDGDLPTSVQRERFAAEVAGLRTLPDAVRRVLPVIAGAAAPGSLATLRGALSVLAVAEQFRPSLDATPAELRLDGLRMSAVTPTINAALLRLGRGDEPIEPRPDLDHCANYLYMLTGAEADPARVRAIQAYMTSTIEHGFNASTFTARVVTSTGADAGSAVVAALGSLSGPLHGGAPSRALATLDAIGTPDRAAAWIRDAVANGQRIMGFGHPVYRTDDPRAMLLRRIARDLGGPLAEFAEQVEQITLDTLAELKPGQPIRTNVEFYAGVVMELCGLPRELFTPTFAASRVVGWCAHLLEQAADDRIIRPSARYVGPAAPAPLPDYSLGSSAA